MGRNWEIKNPEKAKANERRGQAAARSRIRLIINAIKISMGCSRCPEKHPATLQFHHRDPSQKLFTIANAVSQKIPLDKVFEEIMKCVLLCANCHAKEHYDGI